jgi:hypothetical protein
MTSTPSKQPASESPRPERIVIRTFDGKRAAVVALPPVEELDMTPDPEWEAMVDGCTAKGQQP